MLITKKEKEGAQVTPGIAPAGSGPEGEAVAKQAAAQGALELARNEVWEFAAGVALCGLGQERGSVLAEDAVK